MRAIPRLKDLDLQTKIILVLVGVIIPTFFFVSLVQYKVTQPLLEQEWKQIGISTAESLAIKVVSNRWLARPALYALIDLEIQAQTYLQPSIVRMDVYSLDAETNRLERVASNVEDDPSAPHPVPGLVGSVTAEFVAEDEIVPLWEIRVPIRQLGAYVRGPGRIVGMVHVLVSTKSVARLMGTVWRVTAVAGVVTVFLLIGILSYFLRRTIANERLLRVAEDRNVELARQLHDVERQLMNVEKLAVMGQLTANVAHEIGTPLNAIGGHLQLLRESLAGGDPAPRRGGKAPLQRLEIIQGELNRIEGIVKSFLQTTAKPSSQPQLVDINALIDKTIEIVRPRVDGTGIEVSCVLDRKMGPVRAVPLDLQQVLLNLVNNSLDSLQEKRKRNPRARAQLVVRSGVERSGGEEVARLTVRDTGIGIPREDLKNVTKPFFTTKPPGEGTGLGLTISSELVAKYGGRLGIQSRPGWWVEVSVRIPYRGAA